MRLKAQLNWNEFASAAREGVQRRIRSIKEGRVDKLVTKTNAWANDVQSCCAERAAAKALNVYWPESSNLDRKEDLPGNIHIRATDRLDGCLIAHHRDPDDGRFYLVVGQDRDWEIVGWLYGHEAKNARYWRDNIPEPAFLAPQGALHDPENPSVNGQPGATIITDGGVAGTLAAPPPPSS